MRVAAIQMSPIFKDKAANIRHAVLLVLQAAKEGAHIAVLPELCTTGYSFLSKEEAREQAETLNDTSETLSIFQNVSKETGMYIAWGMVISVGDRLYNAQVLVGPHGELYSYAKVNLWGNDFLWATPGSKHPTIAQVRYRNMIYHVGMLVCRDVRDKSESLGEFYYKGDTDVVLMSTNWGKGGFPAVSWINFAENNATHLVVANRFGVEEHNDFGMGGSCIVSPTKQVTIQGLKMGAPCVVIGDV